MQIFQKVILLKVPGYSAIYAMGNGNFSAIIIVNKNYKQAPFFFFLNKYIILKIQDYLEKYIEPLSLMKKDGYILFRNDRFEKLKFEA